MDVGISLTEVFGGNPTVIPHFDNNGQLTSTSNLFWNLSAAIENEKKKIKAVKCLNIKGYLNCKENFTEHPKILNETSDLIIKILGKKNGEHSRTVVGVNSLPLNSPIEIDGIFSLIF